VRHNDDGECGGNGRSENKTKQKTVEQQEFSGSQVRITIINGVIISTFHLDENRN
jgi:hypothetical protein